MDSTKTTIKINNISKLRDCFGCGVCAVSCPQKIIILNENKNGFYTPQIVDSQKCTNCGFCLSVCSFFNRIDTEEKPKVAFAGWSLTPKIREVASSGGVGFEFARKAIAEGYEFCGVKYISSKKRAVHYLGVSEDDIYPSLGSKYIQSYTVSAFEKFKNNGKYIVFGTPCQIASLRLWLKKRKKQDQFLLVDFYCHGVPSLKIWDKYVKENDLMRRDISTVSWRDKKNGWHDSWYIVANDRSGKEIFRSKKVNSDLFYQYFLGHYALNKCCIESCKFKKNNSCADIRIGDLWGKSYESNNDGVSGILCLTDRGREFVESTERIQLTTLSDEIVGEGQMASNAVKPWGYSLVRKMMIFRFLSLQSILNIKNGMYFIQTLPQRIINIFFKIYK